MTDESVAASGPRTVSFTVTPTTADLMSNAMTTTRSSTSAIAVGTFLLAIGVVALALGVRDLMAVAFPLVLGTAFLTGAFILPFMWWSIRQRRDLILAPMEVTADQHALALTAAVGSSRTEWSAFRRARELPLAFLLETGTPAAVLIMKRGASDRDLAALRDLLARVGLLQPGDSSNTRRMALAAAFGLLAAAATIMIPRLL